MEMLKDKDQNTSFNAIHFLICSLIIGVTIISFPTNGLTYTIVRLVQAIELLILAVLFLPRFQLVMKVNKFNLFVNIWWLGYVLNTFLHPTNVGITPVFTWLNVAIFLLIGKIFWKDNMRDTLKTLATIFSFLVYINGILLILFPEGLWIDPEWVGRGSDVRYLFGNQNQTGLVCIFAVTTQCLYTFAYNKGRFNLFLLVVVSAVSILFLGSMTSTIGIALITLYIVFNRFFKRPYLLLVIFTIIYLAVFLLIVWFGNDIEGVKWLTTFVEVTLNKDTTFSRRTIIWENAVALIRQQPLLGYGIQNVDWNDSHLGGSGTHNLWVMLLMNSGFIGCISFIFILIHSVRNALTVRLKITTAAVMALCVLLIMSFFEAYSIIYIFLFLQIVYYSANIPIQANTPPQTQENTTTSNLNS